MIYSFDLSDYEAGRFVATRHPEERVVGGDWVCSAQSDGHAMQLAREAAHEVWIAPLDRRPGVFTVEFRDCAVFGPGQVVEVELLWPQNMSAVWVVGFRVVRDENDRLIAVLGPDGVERLADRRRVRLGKGGA